MSGLSLMGIVVEISAEISFVKFFPSSIWQQSSNIYSTRQSQNVGKIIIRLYLPALLVCIQRQISCCAVRQQGVREGKNRCLKAMLVLCKRYLISGLKSDAMPGTTPWQDFQRHLYFCFGLSVRMRLHNL